VALSSMGLHHERLTNCGSFPAAVFWGKARFFVSNPLSLSLPGRLECMRNPLRRCVKIVKNHGFLGIDPGREKFGWAFGTSGEGLLCSGIGETGFFPIWIRKILEERAFSLLGETLREGDPKTLGFFREFRLFLGTGTGSGEFERVLREMGYPFSWGEESFSTLEARKLYWERHPPQGLRRFLPRDLLFPPRPLDDLAAWCIVKRALGF